MKLISSISLLAAMMSAFSVQMAAAVPNITGAIMNTQFITITGSNFGIKTPAAPLLWDDFSRGTSGQPLSSGTGSPWTVESACAGTYSNAIHYGQNALSAAQVLKTNAACHTRTTLGVLGNQTKIFLSYHYYVVPGGTGDHTKMGRIGSDNDVHSFPLAGLTAFNPNYWYVIAGSVETNLLNMANGAPEGQWTRDDLWSTIGTKNVANGTVGAWRNAVRLFYNTAVKTLADGASSTVYNQVFLPYYNESGTRTIYIGDVYIDNTLARVELGNKASWLSCTKREIQIPSEWAGSRAVCKINRGTFGTSDKLFLYVVDASGATNAVGYPVFGAGQGDTIPSTPSNLNAIAVSSVQINLTWTESSNNETGFVIERKINPTSTWAQCGSVGPNVTTFSSTGLGASHTFYYRVYALGDLGASGYSNEASATTLSTGIVTKIAQSKITHGMVGQWILAVGGRENAMELDDGYAKMTVYDVSGKKVWQYRRKTGSSGMQTVLLPSALSGIFYLQLK